MVLIEAAAAGRPAVSSAVGGVAEVIDDGATGLLCAPEDPAVLAEAMARVMKLSAKEREAMGRAARRRAEDVFALDAVVDRWMDLYAAGAGAH